MAGNGLTNGAGQFGAAAAKSVVNVDNGPQKLVLLVTLTDRNAMTPLDYATYLRCKTGTAERTEALAALAATAADSLPAVTVRSAPVATID